MEKSITKWDQRFLDVAWLVAGWSKDPSTKTGAVIVRPDKTICSVGYNGFPAKLNDSDERYNDRDLKYKMIVHCEMNAVLNMSEKATGYILYTVPFLSCDRCAVHMISAGITRVVAPRCPEDKLERWGEILEHTKQLFREAGIEVVEV